MANLMLSVMGAFAEFERSLNRERQREGIALARQRGAGPQRNMQHGSPLALAVTWSDWSTPQPDVRHLPTRRQG